MERVWCVPQPLCRPITSKDTMEAKSCPSNLGVCLCWGWEQGTTRSPGGYLWQILNPPGGQPSPSEQTLCPWLPQLWQGPMASGDSPARVRDSPTHSD